MGTAKATKTADKALICKKLVTALQKMYGKSVPKIELPVVDTFLFGVCLEDSPWDQAEAALKRSVAAFFDLNEVRVSSVTELAQQMNPLRDSEWKAMRVRSVLRAIFESNYSYDYEKFRRQTLEQALKSLKKFPDLTPFVRDFVLHELLGSHVIVMDTLMLTASRWLGLVPAGADNHEASEFLKPAVRKADVSEFCHLLRCLATDPRFAPWFAEPVDRPLSMHNVMERLVEVQHPPKRKPKPAPPVAPPQNMSAVGEVKKTTPPVPPAKPAVTAPPASPPKVLPSKSGTPGTVKPGAPSAAVKSGSPVVKPATTLPPAKPLAATAKAGGPPAKTPAGKPAAGSSKSAGKVDASKSPAKSAAKTTPSKPAKQPAGKPASSKSKATAPASKPAAKKK
jgi:endonuclease-3